MGQGETGQREVGQGETGQRAAAQGEARQRAAGQEETGQRAAGQGETGQRAVGQRESCHGSGQGSPHYTGDHREGQGENTERDRRTGWSSEQLTCCLSESRRQTSRSVCGCWKK